MKNRLMQAAVAVVNIIGLYAIRPLSCRLRMLAPSRDILYNTTASTVAMATSTSDATTLNDISVAGSRMRQNGTCGSSMPVTTFSCQE